MSQRYGSFFENGKHFNTTLLTKSVVQSIMNNVHIGDESLMNTVVTSKTEILKISRELIQRNGWSAINVRTIAAACGVSVGAIYNYFDSKVALVEATVESVWCDIFHEPENGMEFSSFLDCIDWIYQCIKEGSEKYPDFVTLHALSFAEDERSHGQQLMVQSWKHIKNSLSAVLKKDTAVREGAFCEAFTEEKFVDLVFSIILSSLLQQCSDNSTIREVIRRTIY